MRWYLHDGKMPIGPFTPAELAARPGFALTTQVFPEGGKTQDEWRLGSAVPEIVTAMSAKSVPPPPPAGPQVIVLTAAPPRPEPEPAPAAAPAPAVERKPEPVEAKPQLPSADTKKILIVDDDEAVRSFVEMTTQMQGFQVSTAVDGNDAIKKMNESVPDLVITDLMMPGLGGYELLRAMQGIAARVPIFVITGSTLDDSTVQMIRAEANVVEFVAKPIKVPKFVAALHHHLKTQPK